MAAVLVGTMISGRPNFMTVTHTGVLHFGDPRYLTINAAKVHASNTAIRANGTFSVNIPSVELVQETDYCGLCTGSTTDKSSLFDVFFGTLPAAPMIDACPINIECLLYETIDFPSHYLFIGEIIEAYCDDEVMTDGTVDFIKVRPLLCDMQKLRYFSIGTPVARCWKAGNDPKISMVDRSDTTCSTNHW